MKKTSSGMICSVPPAKGDEFIDVVAEIDERTVLEARYRFGVKMNPFTDEVVSLKQGD